MKNIAEQILEGLSKFYVGFQNRRVLKTMEEIEANTDEQNIPSALLLGEINNKLAHGRIELVVQSDGTLGYKLDGADTVIPFKSKPQILLIGSGNTTATKTFSATSIKNYQKLTSDNFFLRPSVHGQGGGSSRGSYGISYNPATGIITVNEYVIGVTEWDRPFCAYLIYQLYAYV